MLKKITGSGAKVQRANKKVKSALSLFATAKKQVEDATQAIKEAIEADKKEISNLESNIEVATTEIKGNEALISKLNEFLPNK